jgi:DNA-binding NarL/FixJ family response regulator
LGHAKGTPVSAAISILLVEDEALTRERLAAVITRQPGWQLFGTAGSLAQARTVLVDQPPTVLLTDLGLPDGSGTHLIRECKLRWPALECLVISVMGDEASVLDAVAAGAGGYLLKDACEAEIVAAVQQLLSGGAPLSPSIAVHLLRRLQAPTQVATALSAREIELLRLIAKGLTYEEVGQALGLRYNTVASYAKGLYRKLEVNSRGEAVFEALQMGLVSPP